MAAREAAAAGAYFIFPATVTQTDEGRVLKTKRAELHANDGTERVWRFDTTTAAREEAEFWFDVPGWKADDLGTLWSL